MILKGIIILVAIPWSKKKLWLFFKWHNFVGQIVGQPYEHILSVLIRCNKMHSAYVFRDYYYIFYEVNRPIEFLL